MGDIAGGGQGALRLGVFLAVCLGLGLWEAWWPRRGDARRRVRWPVNLSLAVVNSVIVRVLAPASGVTFALLAEGRGLGLLRAVTWPAAVEFALAVLVLDAAVYLQHRLFHVVPLLWTAAPAASRRPRLRLHHRRALPSRRDRDFHGLQGRLHRRAGRVAGGHAGVRDRPQHRVAVLPRQRAAGRRSASGGWLFVTPDMHRVHHSTDGVEQNTNFGFSFSWWDRLGGTYRPTPQQPHETMPIGIDAARP